MKTWVKYILVLAILGIIGAIAVYELYINKSHPEYENLEALYIMNASDLYYTYKSNREIADSKYTGQIIQISGVIKTVEQHDTIVTAVMVFDEGMFGDEGIRCSFLPVFHEEVLSWKADELHSIKGLCVGYNDTDVILDKCSLPASNN